jgi:hypothetical protein
MITTRDCATTWDPTIRRRVQVATTEAFIASRLGLDASDALTSLHWLCLTGQRMTTSGRCTRASYVAHHCPAEKTAEYAAATSGSAADRVVTT